MRLNQRILSPLMIPLLAFAPFAVAGFWKAVKVEPEPKPAQFDPPRPPYLSRQIQPFEVVHEHREFAAPHLQDILRENYRYPAAKVEPLPASPLTHAELEELIRTNANAKRFIQLGSHGEGLHGMNLAMAVEQPDTSAERILAIISLEHDGMGQRWWVLVHGYVKASNVNYLNHRLDTTLLRVPYMTVGKAITTNQAFGVLEYL